VCVMCVVASSSVPKRLAGGLPSNSAIVYAASA